MNGKFTFNKKESALDINSIYIITANNINEIIDVINNISNQIELKAKKTDFFKYLSICIPTNINSDCDLIITFSKNINFLNSIQKSLSENFSNFLYFNDGQYERYNQTYINENNAGHIFLFELNNDLIPDNCFYIKYQIIKKVNNEIIDQKILSYYNIEKRNDKIDKIGIEYFESIGDPIIFDDLSEQKIFEVNLLTDTITKPDNLSAYYTATIDGENIPDFSKLSITNEYISNSSTSGLIVFNDDIPTGNTNITFNYPGFDTIEKQINVKEDIEDIQTLNLSKTSIDFSNVEHNWYFVWDGCSGYISGSSQGTYMMGAEDANELSYFNGRSSNNYIGWDKPNLAVNNSDALNKPTNIFYLAASGYYPDMYGPPNDGELTFNVNNHGIISCFIQGRRRRRLLVVSSYCWKSFSIYI